MKRQKSYWIKERHNPQFDKPYYAALGQISKREADRNKKPLYGENVMLEFSTLEAYEKKIKELIRDGFTVY